MKIRNGWVGNSSSSSFIIVGEYPVDLVNKFGSWWIYKLEGEQKERAIRFAKNEIELNDGNHWFKNNDNNKDLLDSKNDVYITTFISDSGEEMFKGVCNLTNSFHIEEGGHGYPYDEECFDELVEEEIWLRNEEKTEKYWREAEYEESYSEYFDIDNKPIQKGDMRFQIEYRTPFYILSYDKDSCTFNVIDINRSLLVRSTVDSIKNSILSKHYDNVFEGLNILTSNKD